MGNTPSPTTRFHVYGQGLYLVKPTSRLQRPSDVFIFAVAEESHQWLGWYVVHTNEAIDAIIMESGKVGVDYDIIAEKNASHGSFTVDKPMTVEDLCGKFSVTGGMVAKCMLTFGQSNKSYVSLSVVVHVFNTFIPFTLRMRASDAAAPPAGTRRVGYGNYMFSEPFNYPVKHINVTSRLKTLRRNTLQQPRN